MFDLEKRDIARFWSKVAKSGKNECWPWTAKSKHWLGYGLFTIANGKPGGIKVVSSRIACFLEHGPAPELKPHALHSCDNPPCCNPKHLRWGTQKDNASDAKERNRLKNPPRVWDNPIWKERALSVKKRGVDASCSSLDEPQVREIWSRWLGGEGSSSISRSMNIPHHVVYDVCRGRSYRELDGAPSVAELKAVRKPAGNPALQEGQVREIWRRFLSGESNARIARDMGISELVSYDVCRGRSWRHLPDAPSLQLLKQGGKRRGFNQFG
jgi:hypothetical protein